MLQEPFFTFQSDIRIGLSVLGVHGRPVYSVIVRCPSTRGENARLGCSEDRERPQVLE